MHQSVAEMAKVEAPAFEEVVAAREFISNVLPRTPLVRSDKLSSLLGCDYYIKHENLQPIGVFKIRGGVNLVGSATPEELRAGIVTASTGNHGQSIAYAGRMYGVRVIVYAPAQNMNETKLQGMRFLGAEVRLHGANFDEARSESEIFAKKEGYRYVHTANESKLIAGVGTIAMEILEDLPNVDVIIAPIGSGTCVSSCCIVTEHLKPDVRVVAVQSDAAPGMWHAWKNRNLEPCTTMKTEHDGLATRVPFEMPMKVLWDSLNEFVLVSEREIDEAIRLLARDAKQIAEGAGAASLAGAIALAKRPPSRESLHVPDLKGKKVVGILTGGNIRTDKFADLMQSASA